MLKILLDKQCLSEVISMQLVFSNMHLHAIQASALYNHNANKILIVFWRVPELGLSGVIAIVKNFHKVIFYIKKTASG